MNADRLLAHYERIADAPDAVARLRRFILDLAVRGKLVPQDPHDEPASELLTRIAAEKAWLGVRHIADPLGTSEVPYELPLGWGWSRIGEICSKTGSGSTPRGGKEVYKQSGVPFLRSQNVYDDDLRLDDVAYIDPETHERMGGTKVLPGDLLLNITGGSIGRCCRVPDVFDEANISQHVAIIRPAIRGVEDYLHCLVRSPYFQAFVIDEQTGAGRGGLPKNRMDRIAVALPPLAEQHRIVAKVDALMALCDRLEAARAERETTRDRFAAASLARLNAPDPAAFPADARFALAALPALTARPDQIKHLRQTILNLAVRGKLVPQDPNDEPAAELLKRIAAEKATAQTGRMKSTKDLSANGEAARGEDEIPASWCWAPTERLCEEIVDCPHSTPVFVPSGIICLDTNSFKERSLLEHKLRFVSGETYQERVRRLVPRAGDIVFAREGSVGELFIVPDGMKCCLGQRVMLFRPMLGVTPTYFSLALSSPSSLARLLELHKGIGARHVNVADMRKALIPFPPLAEQHRIVAKVDALMALCDRLEASLTETDATRRRLLEALLAEALAPSVVAA